VTFATVHDNNNYFATQNRISRGYVCLTSVWTTVWQLELHRWWLVLALPN